MPMRNCNFEHIMSVWEQLYELYSDFQDLNDEDIIAVRPTIENRIDDAIAWLNFGCNITDEDVQEYVPD